MRYFFFFFFQAEDGIRDLTVTGVQTCALPIFTSCRRFSRAKRLVKSSTLWSRKIRRRSLQRKIRKKAPEKTRKNTLENATRRYSRRSRRRQRCRLPARLDGRISRSRHRLAGARCA